MLWTLSIHTIAIHRHVHICTDCNNTTTTTAAATPPQSRTTSATPPTPLPRTFTFTENMIFIKRAAIASPRYPSTTTSTTRPMDETNANETKPKTIFLYFLDTNSENREKRKTKKKWKCGCRFSKCRHCDPINCDELFSSLLCIHHAVCRTPFYCLPVAQRLVIQILDCTHRQTDTGTHARIKQNVCFTETPWKENSFRSHCN